MGPRATNSGDAVNYAKLFVGSLPPTVTEDDIRPLFAKYGNVLEVALIKDKEAGQLKRCCFIKYATIEEADRAIRALHNHHTLRGGICPIQVRYANGERERLGTMEYKLFVGSLSKDATEKEIEEIFAPYGHVDDVYIMRDEQKQSRGCAFVKYLSRKMAIEATSALSEKYIMKGSDQPLTIRFADLKRPKTRDMRAGPAYGGSGFGSQPHGPPGVRPSSGYGHMGGHGPPTNWRPMGTPSMGPSFHVGGCPYASTLIPRGGTSGAPTAMAGTVGGPGICMNGSVPVAGMGTPPSQHQQIQTYGQQPTTLQKPLQYQQLPFSMLQQHQQPPQSFSQVQQSHQSLHQFGQHTQLLQPNVQISPSLGQLSSTQQSLSLYGQLPASQPQGHSHMTPTCQQVPLSLQQQLRTLDEQLPQSLNQPQQHLQLQMQPQQQPQQQQQHLRISMPHQGHATQSGFPSQQFLYLQDQQHRIHAISPSIRTPVTCNWTKHNYYYNSVTQEIKCEKPEEFAVFEKQQQQPVPQQTQSQVQPQHQLQGQLFNQVQQLQHETQQPQLQQALATSMGPSKSTSLVDMKCNSDLDDNDLDYSSLDYINEAAFDTFVNDDFSNIICIPDPSMVEEPTTDDAMACRFEISDTYRAANDDSSNILCAPDHTMVEEDMFAAKPHVQKLSVDNAMTLINEEYSPNTNCTSDHTMAEEEHVAVVEENNVRNGLIEDNFTFIIPRKLRSARRVSFRKGLIEDNFTFSIPRKLRSCKFKQRKGKAYAKYR